MLCTKLLLLCSFFPQSVVFEDVDVGFSSAALKQQEQISKRTHRINCNKPNQFFSVSVNFYCTKICACARSYKVCCREWRRVEAI
jgi:hypothetical protein